MSAQEGNFKFVEEANQLERVQILTLGDAILSFLIAPANVNFQEQLAQISADQK
jgi:hypothetical protein